MHIALVTLIPSPYQVELFNAVQARGEVGLTVAYVERQAAGRQWQMPDLTHEAVFLGEAPDAARRHLLEADVAVFSNYSDARVRAWMAEREAAGRPWAFWGERPGYALGPGLGGLPLVGRLLGPAYRRLRLAPLHASRAAVWGIGNWAVDRYRREFGPERAYVNLPYFSNLRRFREATPPPGAREGGGPLRLLYSGSLTRRKGVDLLARAFAAVAPGAPHLRLDVVGDGPLRPAMQQTLAPVTAQVTFHGFTPWDALPALYARADVLVAPSRYDGWALVVPEGLAAGLPVVSTDRTGAALDLVVPHATGWRVPAGALAPLRDVVAGLARMSHAELRRMGRCGQEAVFRTHSLVRGAARFEAAARRTAATYA
jgi:glycosyltransferase involved in cell wall biosynthesis